MSRTFFWWIEPVMGLNKPRLLKTHESATMVPAVLLSPVLQTVSQIQEALLEPTVCKGWCEAWRMQRWLTLVPSLKDITVRVQEADIHTEVASGQAGKHAATELWTETWSHRGGGGHRCQLGDGAGFTGVAMKPNPVSESQHWINFWRQSFGWSRKE